MYNCDLLSLHKEQLAPSNRIGRIKCKNPSILDISSRGRGRANELNKLTGMEEEQGEGERNTRQRGGKARLLIKRVLNAS